MRPEDLQDLSLLGQKSVPYIFEYTPDVLEAFPNRHPENDYFVKFNAPEFTSLCPITNQPDFATIYISYIPDEKLVESKSLKLYLFSFRNHGDFHENCINVIGKDLVKLMEPRYLEVWGNSHHVAVSRSIRTTTTENRVRSMKKWRSIACSTMTCIQRRSTTVN